MTPRPSQSLFSHRTTRSHGGAGAETFRAPSEPITKAGSMSISVSTTGSTVSAGRAVVRYGGPSATVRHCHDASR
jgi:hypothetical protein